MNDMEKVTEVKTVMEIGRDRYLEIYDVRRVSIKDVTIKQESKQLKGAYEIRNKNGIHVGTYYSDSGHLVLIL